MKLIQDVGFWDYTAPQHGSLEAYTEADWDELLDDLAQDGVNSLVICVKWITTGYRSALPWLDQDPICTAISTDNRTLHYGFREARKRGFKIWLLIVATQFPVEKFGLEPVWAPEWMLDVFGGLIGYYDADHPGLRERIHEMVAEITELFGQYVDGVIAELEFCDRAEPHRVEGYNRWAVQNNRPDYETVSQVPLQPRCYPFTHWRDYATHRRITLLREIEETLRENGFTGEYATIAEFENSPGCVMYGNNMAMLREEMPHMKLITYDSLYNRNLNRQSTVEMCMRQPREMGFEVNFLSRGVMPLFEHPDTFGPLEAQWQMTIDDAKDALPHGLYFMGCDARTKGMVCDSEKLKPFGFETGRQARKKLMNMLKNAGLI